MDKCKAVVKEAGIIPDLQLAIQVKDDQGKKKGVKGTGPHRVKLLEDHVVMGTDYQTGVERHEIKLIVEENGQKKQYCFPVKDKKNNVHYLVQRFAEVKPGDEVILEFKKRGIKGFIEVIRIGEDQEPENSDDDIPVIEDDSQEPFPDDFGK